jgi:drug/metabolite transporter (DMT)-like permease
VDGSTNTAWATVRVGTLALLWGATFLWIELALDALSPVQVTVARSALGAATLLVACFGSGRRLPRGRALWGRIVVAAFFCNALPFTMFSIGQQTIDSGVAGVLNATTPLWSLLLGLLIGAERPIRPTRLTGLVLGFGGTVLIFAPWQQADSVGWGALAVVVAAASYAVGFTFMGRQLAGRGVPTISLSAAQMCAATGLSALSLPRDGFAPVELDAKVVLAVLVLGVFSTGVTFHLTFRVIADEGATNASAVGYLLPVVSIALGVIVLGEQFSLRIAAGMAVVLLGVGMTRRRDRSAPPSPLAAPHATKTGVRT